MDPSASRADHPPARGWRPWDALARRRSAGSGPGGLALRWHLVALLLLPIITVGTFGSVLVDGRLADARRGLLVQEQILAAQRIDAARSTIAREVVPTLVAAVLRQPGGDAALGLGTEAAASLARSTRESLDLARGAADGAVRRASASAIAAADIAPASAQLRALRAEADAGTVSPDRLVDAYLLLADGLASAEQADVVQATANGLSPASSLATYDVLTLARLAQTASAQLPRMLLAQLPPAVASGAVATGPGDGDGATPRTEWLAAWGLYHDQQDKIGDVSDASLRTHWRSVTQDPASAGLDATIDEAVAGATSALTVAAVVTMTQDSALRDSGFSWVLATAVGHAEQIATADRDDAVHRVHLAVGVEIAVLLIAVGAGAALARTTSRSLGHLATAARRISEGELVEVPERGPREVRTVARALGAAVANLRRVQEQATAVACGDLTDDVLAQPLPGRLGEVLHASVQRIVTSATQHEQLRQMLAHQAAHDPLTGLANRAQVLDRVRGALARGRRAGTRTALLFIDLDRFKHVNDTLGHAHGDEVLRVVAQRLLAGVRAGDVVGRLGGDEFLVLVEGTGAAEDASDRDLVALAERLVDALSVPVPVGAPGAGGVRSVDVGASIGLTVDLDGTLDATALLHEADIAVYRAKNSGRGRVQVFGEAMRAELAERAELEAALARAVAEGGLELHYQPVINAASGDLDGFEGLCRWERPGVGRVPPDVFIPVAEETALVSDLGRWVLLEGTRQLALWSAQRDPSLTPLRLGLNVSGRHLVDPRVLTDVADALAASGVRADQLVLEITETVLVDDPIAAEHLRALRELGCLVAIDDFGTGYTSIGQLGRMPADILKIDRSFVDSDAPGDEEIMVLATSAAHTFGLAVVAEGVETTEQDARVRAAGCDLIQGYLHSRPLPAAQAGALLAATSVPGADHGKSIHASVARQVKSGTTTDRGLV